MRFVALFCFLLLLTLSVVSPVSSSQFRHLLRQRPAVSVEVSVDMTGDASEAPIVSEDSREYEVNQVAPNRRAAASSTRVRRPTVQAPIRAPPSGNLVPAVPTAGSFRIQVGAFREADLAVTAWDSIKARVPMVGSLPVFFVQGPSVTRLQLGNWPNRQAPEAVCQSVRFAKFPCLVAEANTRLPTLTTPPPIRPNPISPTLTDPAIIRHAGEPDWMLISRRDIGKGELAGRGDSTFVVGLWQQGNIPGNVDDEETPWCAAWVSAKLEQAGIRSSRSGWARSYLNWGQRLTEPAIGAIVVFSRGPKFGHVGFVAGKDGAGNLMVLGGNQGDSVTIEPKSTNRLLGYRWPTGRMLPINSQLGFRNLPVVLPEPNGSPLNSRRGAEN